MFWDNTLKGDSTHFFEKKKKCICATVSSWPVIYFYLMLAPLASMVIPGSQYSNFIFNIFIVVILFLGNREYK